jgi:bifunctional DNase/RNase
MRTILMSAVMVMGMGVAVVATPVSPHAPQAVEVAAGEVLTEVRVRDVVPLAAAHQAAIILTPAQGEMVLPVLVTESEGASLAGQIHGHGGSNGLLKKVITELGGKLLRVELRRVEGESVVAQLIVDQRGHALALEGSAADSIALALESRVPVMATRAVMDGLALTREQIRALAGGGATRAPARAPGHAPSGGAHALDTQGGGISL